MKDWWLKVQRAEKHMSDIMAAASQYRDRNPYELIRLRVPDDKMQVKYRVHFTDQPDPMITVMLGDFVHNLRSALDYIVVAGVPRNRRRRASFPILTRDIFAKDETGEFVVNDAEARTSFESAINGLHPAVRSVVMSLQPYTRGKEAKDHILGIMSRLENADKHRQLSTVGAVVRNLALDFVIQDLPGTITWPNLICTGRECAQDNTIITYDFPGQGLLRLDSTPIYPSEVAIRCKGATEVVIKIADMGDTEPPSNHELGSTMNEALTLVRDVLGRIEPWITFE